VLNALRQRYPTARIDWLLKPSAAELVRHHPAVSNVLIYGENQTEVPQYNWDGFTHFLRLLRDSRFLRLLRALRFAKYDLVVDLHGQLRTGFVTLLTGAPVRIGFDRPRRQVWERAGQVLPKGTVERAWRGAREGSWIAYNHPIRLDTLSIHAVDRYLQVGKLLGFDVGTPDFSFPIPIEAHQRVERLLNDSGIAVNAKPIILLSPAALWETKRWLPERFAEVARYFIRAGHPVVITGSDAERAECSQVGDAAPGSVNLAGQTTLPDLAALMSRVGICLTNDSGPLHLAVACRRPVIGVYGPTNPMWVGPYGRERAVILAGVPCAPCYLRPLSRCPHNQVCMRNVEAPSVIERIEEILSQKPNAAARC
jgi:ADP-heptose:LPS heptosyltransferase